MPRLKMVWLPLRKWISFLPVAFIIYILLQYLVYHPEIRVSSSERSAFIGEAKLLNLTNSLQNAEDSAAISTTAANGSASKPKQSDTINNKDNSVSYSSSTVERSASASVSSTDDKIPIKPPSVNLEAPKPPAVNLEVPHSISNGRVLSGTNMDTVKTESDVKDEIKNPKISPKTDVKVDSPSKSKPEQAKKDPPAVDKKPPVAKGDKKDPVKNSVSNKGSSIKQAISKNRKYNKTKPKYSIGFLHGKTKVGDIYDKGYMVPQEELCPNNGRDLRVMIFVTTAPDHEHHRNAIRQTWGHFAMRKDVSIAFLVGRPDRPDAQNIIDRENDRYGDIIQSNLIDVYANLTLKTVSMFEWLNTYCSESRFVLKTDDDMYINVPLLLAYIYTKRNDKRSIYGRLARNWKPVRNKKSKYYISKETYSTIKYPEFLTGPAYLFTNDIVEDVYSKAMDSTFFKLEDVFTTGLVAESLEIKRVGDSHFRNEKISLKDTCKLMQTISIHMVKYEEEFDIYKRTLDGKTKCRIK